MRTLNFHMSHKNGWVSYQIVGVKGSLFIDGRLLTADAKANPPATIDIEFDGFVEPGEDLSEKAAAAAAKKLENEAKKAEKAEKTATKANERLAKLQASAAKAQAVVEAARAKVAAASNQTENVIE